MHERRGSGDGLAEVGVLEKLGVEEKGGDSAQRGTHASDNVTIADADGFERRGTPSKNVGYDERGTFVNVKYEAFQERGSHMSDEGEAVAVDVSVFRTDVETNVSPANEVGWRTDEVQDVGLLDIAVNVKWTGGGTSQVSCGTDEGELAIYICNFAFTEVDLVPKQRGCEREVAPVCRCVGEGDLHAWFVANAGPVQFGVELVLLTDEEYVTDNFRGKTSDGSGLVEYGSMLGLDAMNLESHNIELVNERFFSLFETGKRGEELERRGHGKSKYLL
jgi:hypothetical protein